MLEITIPGIEFYNEDTNEFIYYSDEKIKLEHSLISISKWEANWCKPFLNGKDKGSDEILDYIKCMTLTEGVSDEVYSRLSPDNFSMINDYLGRSMTATTFSNEHGKVNREIITSEVIYYWMITLNIPFECQYWHLNRLLTLIKVCNVKNNPPKKMSKNEILSRNKALNEARRKQLNTRG